jgi:hypothetical protein
MRYVFGFLVFLLLIILGLILIFGRHKNTPSNTAVKAPVVLALPDYADTNAATTMTLDGQINGEDAHRAIRITVSRDNRVVETLQGYSGNVIDSHSFPNTRDAYEIFLRALNNSGFNLKQKKTTAPSDYRGQCPDGTREIFELTQGDHKLSNLWTSSCGIGNFGGNAPLVQLLFQRQITDYDQLVQNVQL